MEFSHNEMSPKVCLPSEDDDVKYVSGLSTVLVTTIQEAKDRISEIEYIFCNKLYPNVQKSSKCLQKLYCEARKAAEDEYKERVNELELQVEQLRVEKDQACEYSSKLLVKIADLEEKLLHKAKEVDDGKVLQEAERKRREDAEHKAKLDEIAEKQKQREKELEEKEKLRRQQLLSDEPPARPAPAAHASAPASGKFVPRHLRDKAAPAPAAGQGAPPADADRWETERRREAEAEQNAKLDEIAEKLKKLKQRENWRYLVGDVYGWGLPHGKKGAHTDTPHPAKKGGKTSPSGEKSTPKSGAQLSCGSCKKTFTSEDGLQSHTKAKHSGGK